MSSSVPNCRQIDAPSMAVPPEPLLIADSELRVAYRASPALHEQEQWIVTSFARYLHISYGYPNDEALGAHPLAQFGLGFYGVFEVDNSPLVQDIDRRNAIHPRHAKGAFASIRHWIITFQDETLDVLSRDCPRFEVVNASTAAEALERQKRA